MNQSSANLPPRYTPPPLSSLFRRAFDVAVARHFPAARTVLDAGSGATPAVPPAKRQLEQEYVGLDISSAELARAGSDAYDESWPRDICVFEPSLEGRFDLVISMFLLEHVRPIDAALINIHRYLKPGGRLIAQFAGGRSASAWINRLLPERLSRTVVTALHADRKSESVFPAEYDRCTPSELAPVLGVYSSFEFLPQFTGAMYFAFNKAVLKAYLALEEATLTRPDAASWYLLEAVR